MSRLLGIAREPVYSPGKVTHDRAILDAVAARLRTHHEVRVISADDPLPDTPEADLVFAMCQGPAALDTLRRWEQAGTPVVNTAAAIASCHRAPMLAAFARHGVAHPPSALVATEAPAPLPAWLDGGGWVKRGDVHATEAGDVVPVADRAAASAALTALQRRGIATALVQQHVDGTVIKFYAVRGRFFSWFAPPAAATANPPDVAALTALAGGGADALELEVFGGDIARDRQGGLWLIDLNDWPSYAPCRSEAAGAISAYLSAESESRIP